MASEKDVTKTIASFHITLIGGVRYRASRPIAKRGQKVYPVTIEPLRHESLGIVINGLNYDDANALIGAFNNEAMSFSGRLW